MQEWLPALDGVIEKLKRAGVRSLVVASAWRTSIGRFLLISTAALAAASIACFVVAVELAIHLAGAI